MKNKIRSLIATALALGVITITAAISTTGCASKVAPGGVYNGDSFLANVDKQLDFDYSALDSFVAWEATNREAIHASWPSVTTGADYVRANAKQWFITAGAVRADYIFVRDSTSGTNAAALTSAQSNLTAQVTFVGAKISDAQTLANSTSLANVPKLTN